MWKTIAKWILFSIGAGFGIMSQTPAKELKSNFESYSQWFGIESIDLSSIKDVDSLVLNVAIFIMAVAIFLLLYNPVNKFIQNNKYFEKCSQKTMYSISFICIAIGIFGVGLVIHTYKNSKPVPKTMMGIQLIEPVHCLNLTSKGEVIRDYDDRINTINFRIPNFYYEGRNDRDIKIKNIKGYLESNYNNQTIDVKFDNKKERRVNRTTTCTPRNSQLKTTSSS